MASAFFLRLSTGRDEEYFFDNLLMLLSAGIDVTSALTSLRKSVSTGAMRTIIDRILADVDSGLPLSEALARQSLLAGPMVELIHIGEQSGNLVENLTVVVTQIRKEKELRAKIASAMIYPLFVFTLTIIVGLGIAWFVLPNLAQVFVRLNVKLPVFTLVLIAVGNFLGAYGAVVVPGILLTLVIAGLLFVYWNPMKQLGESVLFLLPGVQTIIQETELARFGFILGSLLNAGLTFPQAMELLVQSTGFYRYKRFYKVIAARIEEGHTLLNSIQSYSGNEKLIPIPFQELLAAAEKSGSLPATLLHIGELSEARTDLAGKNLTALLEPVLLVIVWLGVLWVAVSVILPIYSLVGGLDAAIGPK